MPTLREALRAVKWNLYPLAAHLRARVPLGRLAQPMTFLFGCGRSGTTILGRVVGCHRRVMYLNEPLHYWNAIDSRTDQINFFGGQGKCFLDAQDVTPGARKRFSRLFGQVEWFAGARSIVEKLPIHQLRMEWLNELCPDARYISIVRDGRYVCTSIARLAGSNNYRISGKNDMNRWWGRSFYKWTTFARECQERDICRELFTAVPEVSPLYYPAMAAIAWIVRARQSRKSIESLQLSCNRILELRYEELVSDATSVFRRIETFLGLPHDAVAAVTARHLVNDRLASLPELALPGPILREFVLEQERIGYPTTGLRELRGDSNSQLQLVAV